MLKNIEYWLLCALGGIAIVLVGANVWLYADNRSAQAEVSARAQYIQQTGSINDLYQQMAKALAELAIKNHDDQLRGMLSQEGFTINPAPAAAATRGKP